MRVFAASGFRCAGWSLVLVLAACWAGCDRDTLPAISPDAGAPGGPGGCANGGDCGGGGMLVCCAGICVDLDHDPRHCGGCGQRCPALANALTTVCTGRACAVGVCRQGFADCDGRADNGCEVELA